MSKAYSPEMLAAARRYFNDAEPRFWRWSDDAITWADGTTIVFYRELADIFRRLALDGLPRFTSLLLLLVACRENYRREHIFWELWQERGLLRDATVPNCPDPNELCAALDRIASLPQELRSSIDAKAALIETVFAGQRFLSAEDALNVLELLLTMPPHELFDEAVRDAGFANAWPAPIEDTQIWDKDDLLGKSGRTRPNVTLALMSMCAGLNRIDADALRLRLRTGLDQLVESAEIEPAPDESLRALISRLRDDPELSGVGRLAHDLMAAAQVPRAVSEPEELPLGGVSDIANRGPLDRLLTSELAHDDLTLAVRVAVGEALYLRREAPPRTPVRERYVLLDCGIRLWGMPRVFAAAVGLALAATVDRHTNAVTWRATADDIEPVDLCTREGLLALLEQLEATPHPALALARFFEAIDRTAASADAILITHEDVLADLDFRRTVDELRNRQLYVASVDREGRFRLSVCSGRGMKLIREARFELDRLLSPPRRPAVALIQHDTGSDLPIILSVEPFPLLLPHQVNLEQMAYHPKFGAVTVAHDRRLMHWRQPGMGAAQITASVPSGRLLHLSIDDGGTANALLGGAGGIPLRLLRADLLTGEWIIVDVDAADEPSLNRLVPTNVVLHQNTLFLVSTNAIRVVHDNGQVSPRCVPTQRHQSGRYFSQGKQAWFALSFDGHAPLLTRVPLHESLRPSTIAQMFDIRGEEGPLAITHYGCLVRVTDGKTIWRGWPGAKAEAPKISPCGRHLLMVCGGTTFHVSIHPERSSANCGVCPNWAKLPLLANPELKRLLRSASLPHRFQHIGTDGSGRLLLLGRQGRVVAIGAGGPNTAVFVESALTGKVHREQSFGPADSPPGVGYTLRLARWADGSRAWLDSLGLLHLKSSGGNLPEITLMLAHSGEIPAWASDGRVWGPTFYTGVEREATRPGEELLAEIEAFVARLK